MSITMLLPSLTVPASAASERSLYLYYTHTGETARIVFKRNGQYVQAGLNQLNTFLRDWRHNEPAKMDPALFDLIWEVYQEVGATQPVNIVSAYRNPATNASLRAVKGSGVAENSQHMRGKAMDFFIPGISLTKLRAAGMRHQVGGVGFYPTSGSPFVHLDTGNVRAWPRMTKAQLQQIFPDGKTLHVPTDGKPLSEAGRQYAMAQWQQCHTVPCNGNTRYNETQVASNDGGSGRSLADMFFGNGEQAPAGAPATVQMASVASTEIAPPVPAIRPAALGAPTQMAAVDQPPLPFSTTGSAPLDDAELLTAVAAPVPATKSQALLLATSAALPEGNGETAVTAIAALTAPIPQPRLQMSNPADAMLTAYAPMLTQDPEAQRALQMIIERSTTASAQPKAPIAVLPPLPGTANGLRTASLGGQPAVNALRSLFGNPQDTSKQRVAPLAAAALATVRPDANAMRNVDLIAPDLEHVAEVFLTPVVMTSDHFAVIYDHDEADFDPTTEMGRYVTVMGAAAVPAELSATRFQTGRPPIVAFN
ncbi:MAG: hypothetical protein JWP26_295 [Devosia sp.]|uniref:DUF882 domain-containing protein n=1 Tax=Devosia sp. TaxID=1871048 RepID=UPI002606842C|nr:DUF882 domain-containing protein [Devosia sp.]MDB5585325.1 hypothetical protein [Devosia sp.]